MGLYQTYEICGILWFYEEEKQDKNTAITNEDIERLKNKAKQYLNTQYG